MRHRRFAWLIGWLVAGACVGATVAADRLWIGGVILSFGLLLLSVPVRWLRWAAVAAAGWCAGGVLARGAELRAQAPDAVGLLVATPGSRPVTVRGVVEPHVRWQADGRRMRAGLRVDAVQVGKRWHPYTGRTWWSWYEPGHEIAPGTAVEVRGRLREPRGSLNAGLFDYGRYLRVQGYHSRLSARGAGAVSLRGRGELPPVERLIASVQRGVADAVRRIPASPDGRGFLLAVLAGDRRWISEDVADASRATGTYHLVSISGLHVGIVAGCILLVVRGCGLRGSWGTAAVVGCLVLYAIATGGRVPVVRATLMCSIALVLLRLRRPPDGLSILAVVAGAVTLLDPLAFRAAGAQLSFGAVAGLLLAYQPAAAYLAAQVPERVPARLRWPVLWLAYAMLVPLIVYVSVAPVLLYHFHQSPVVGVFANTLATPLLCVSLASGGVATVAGLVHPWLGAVPGVVAGLSADLLLGWIDWMAEIAAWLPTVRTFPAPPTLAAYAAALVLAYRLFRHRPRWRLGTVAAGLIALNLAPSGLTPGMLEITALDVGQADATIVRFPTGETMLIDGGRRSRAFDAGDLIVLPALIRSGVRRIDWMIATHGHSDHVGGLLSVLAALPVGEVWTNGSEHDTWTAQRFRDRVSAAGVPVRTVARGHTLRVGAQVLVRVLNPPAIPYAGGGNDENNNGAALRIDYAGTAVLLPADASEALDDIVNAGAPWPDRVIVKAPHHGFPRPGTGAPIAALRPTITWASLSPVWPPRWPLEGLQGAQSSWRTDWHGGVRIQVARSGAITVRPTVGQARTWPGQPRPSQRTVVAGGEAAHG